MADQEAKPTRVGYQQQSWVTRVIRLTRKELRETLRDRRTIITLVLMPLLLYPLISLVIGLILGRLAEGSFHQALMISDHDYSVFILRPLSAAIFALCLLLVLWPGVKKRLGRGGAEVT